MRYRGKGPNGVPQKGRDGDDWHDLGSRCRTALRQEDNGHDRQQESKRHRGGTGFGNRQDRARVTAVSRDDDHVIGGWSSSAYRGRLRSLSRRRFEGDRRLEAATLGQTQADSKGKRELSSEPQFKRFVTFYFTNFLVQNIVNLTRFVYNCKDTSINLCSILYTSLCVDE